MFSVMHKTNALKLRQSVGKLLERLRKDGEPVLIERNSIPAAVLISLKDYQERFVDMEADRQRRDIVEGILSTRAELPSGTSSVSLIRELRK